MSIYLKHRPTKLKKVLGNEEIKDSLVKLTSDISKCPHSFMFTGNTGCGKTTLARILAGMLGSSGSDLREMNSSEFRGIDSIRDIMRNAQYKPLESESRVFIIDECHQLTKDAQNAFLKILEDTPSHVYFILCTTDPNKLLPAIKNRCTRYEVKPLPDSMLSKLIKDIVKKEKESLEDEVLEQILEESNGEVRDVLQILEKVLSTPEKKRLEIVKQHNQLESESIELCKALIANGSWKKISTILKSLKEQSHDPEGIRRMVLGYAQSVLFRADNKKAGLILECFIDPFYNSGFPGLTFACYSVLNS